MYRAHVMHIDWQCFVKSVSSQRWPGRGPVRERMLVFLFLCRHVHPAEEANATGANLHGMSTESWEHNSTQKNQATAGRGVILSLKTGSEIGGCMEEAKKTPPCPAPRKQPGSAFISMKTGSLPALGKSWSERNCCSQEVSLGGRVSR